MSRPLARWTSAFTLLFGFAFGYCLANRNKVEFTNSDVQKASKELRLSNIQEEQLGDRFLGSWLVDRLDTPENERELVTFDGTGRFWDNTADTLGKHWFCTAGLIFLVTNTIGDKEEKSHITPLSPEFSPSDDVVILSPPGGEPRISMTRYQSGRS